jgi:predicted ATP-grasp superfamily ATP-dependent carboligase
LAHGLSRGLAKTSILALGTGITLLGVMRALAESGAEVVALPDVDPMSRRSRWYRAAPSLVGVTPGTLAARLETLPSPTVLIPCSDAWVRAVATLSPTLRQRFPTSVAPLEAVDLLIDKSRFRAALERLGVPHPRTQTLSGPADLDRLPDAVIANSFLKPVGSQEFFARFAVKAFMTTGRLDMREKLATATGEGFEMMLQEYVPGPPSSHYFVDGFVDRNGVFRARFARRRLRMNPPDFGNSTLMVSVPLSEVAQASDTLDTLFADIRYRGIFSAEFKRDARDGTFKLIEVNARPWWYVEFAARCGVNVCELAVQDALGEKVSTITEYQAGRVCVFPYYDLAAARVDRSAGRLSALDWMRSWVGSYQPVFRWSDPLPAAGEVAQILRRRFT